MNTFVKTISPDSYHYGEPSVQLVKSSSRGVVGQDLRDLVKRASDEMVFKVRDYEKQPGEALAHLITMGATEFTGPNNNGDGFPKEALDHYHRTFLTHAHPFRNHLNKNAMIKYGRVVAQAFRPSMGRGELLVAYNETKEAAARNQGLVADLEMQKLASQGSFAVSMSCSVPEDYCSGCGNAARNRHYYCSGKDEGGHCKYGGLKNRMGRLCEDGHHLHAVNRKPMFFDISHITNEKQADQIAHALGLAKEAAERACGALVAEAYGSPISEEVFAWGLAEKAARQAKTLFRLARLEEDFETNAYLREAQSNRAFDSQFFARKEAFSAPQKAGAEHWKALSQAGVVLPLGEFLETACHGEISSDRLHRKAAECRSGLPRVFRSLETREQVGDHLEANPYRIDRRPVDRSMQKWASEHREYNIKADVVHQRMMQHAMHVVDAPSVLLKSASVWIEGDPALQHYALYQVAALEPYYGAPEFGELAASVVRANLCRS